MAMGGGGAVPGGARPGWGGAGGLTTGSILKWNCKKNCKQYKRTKLAKIENSPVPGIQYHKSMQKQKKTRDITKDFLTDKNHKIRVASFLPVWFPYSSLWKIFRQTCQSLD